MEISIIMPVYNEIGLLERSISSVLNQTFSDWELIIVDDGSSDDVLKVCQKYADKETRIRMFRQAHSGQAVARNFGLLVAEGKYIAFMDADDYMHPQMLEQLHEDILLTDTRIAVCGFKRMECLPKISMHTKCKTKIINVADDSKTIKHAIIKDNVYLWNKLYHRSLFADIKFEAGRFYEDMAIMHKLFAKAEKISYNRNILYYYYQNPHGTIQTLNEKKIDDCIWAHEQRVRYYYRKKHETDLNHVTHAFLYKAYELYGTDKIVRLKRKSEIRKKIRKRVEQIFSAYGLIKYLPFHGKLRYWAFVYCSPVFEADLFIRKCCKRLRYKQSFTSDKDREGLNR